MSRLRLVGAVLRGVPYWVRMRSQGLLATVEVSSEPVGRVGGNSRGFTGQRRRGSAPSAALSALRTEPPPRVPGMRLVQYQLLALSGCGRLARSVCFASATLMKGLRLDNNKRIIFRTAKNKDPSR